jgi:secretion/DNA translocation related CpaE-like protein
MSSTDLSWGLGFVRVAYDCGGVADILLLGRDPDLVDHVLALASAAELTVDVRPEVQPAAQVWKRTPLVIVCTDLLAEAAAATLPARPGTVVFGLMTAEGWRHAFDLGAEQVVEPPGEPGWLGQAAAGGEDHLHPAGRVVGVVGCRGGAGASVFACALAVAATRRRMTPYLLDLDPLGCGLGVLLGADEVEGLTWDQVRSGSGRIPVRSLESAVPRVAGVALVGWPDDGASGLDAGVAAAVVDTSRHCAPVTIVDLGLAHAAHQLEALARCDRVFMIVPADVRSVRAAKRCTARLTADAFEIVVRGPNPGGVTGADVAQAVGVPVIAAVAAERGLDARLERGEAPGARRRSPLGRAGDGLLAEVLA